MCFIVFESLLVVITIGGCYIIWTLYVLINIQLLTHKYYKKVFTTPTVASTSLTDSTCVGASTEGLEERPQSQGGCSRHSNGTASTVLGRVRVPCHRPEVGQVFYTGSMCHTSEGEDTSCCELIRTQFSKVLPRG